jgi:toxin-antitoxin system PIN domain toxin
VILIDANLLLYAHFPRYAQHKRARDWLQSRLDGAEAVGLAWQSLMAFVRIATNPRAFPNPEPIGSVWRQVELWLSSDAAWIPQPTGSHARVLGDLLVSSNAYGDLVPDAHLAALAIEHGLTLCSNDRDFARFPKLRWNNPLSDE